MRLTHAAFCLLCIIASGCGDARTISGSSDTGAATDAGGADVSSGTDTGTVNGGILPEITYWKQPDTLKLEESFYTSHPQVFGRMSRFVTHVTGDPRPDVGHRGAFGTGNGHIFGFVGLDYPLNTLHSLVGPTYEKHDERFFGDYRIFLNDAGAAAMQPFDEEWAARSLLAPVLVTRGRRGPLELDTVDFASMADDEAPGSCFLRVLLVRNRGAVPSPSLEIVVDAVNGVSSPEAGAILEGAEKRGLTTRFDLPGAVYRDQHRLALALGSLNAGGERQFVLSHCAREDLTPSHAPVADAGALLDAVAAAYAAYDSRLVSFDLPDPMVADFLDGMKMTLKVQTAATGAACPMSEYTRTWTRDDIGPVLAWLDLGAFEETGALMDYLYGAILEAGDLQNSYPADLDLSNLQPEPDWSSMPTMTGKTAAEGPSYNVMTYGLWHRYTGDTSRFDARFGLVRRCLFAQNFGDGRLLPYSGDETYRAAMNAAFGLPLEYPHQDRSYSSNSSLLWLGASNAYRRLAEATGRSDEAELARLTAVEVEAGMRKHMVLPDGCISAFVNRDTGGAWPAPFEDEALQVTWSGWKDGDDPFARSAFDCLYEQIHRESGVLMSRLDAQYKNWFANAKRGVFTGMLPGFTLAAFTALGHPEARDAFNIAGRCLDTSGNLQEYMIYDDFSGLSIIYDARGGQGDYTAKFRPWEGGIVFDAVFKYLTGFAPDAAAGTIALRPHLPDGWPFARYKNLRTADDRFELEAKRTAPGSFEVSIASHASREYTASLRWDSESGAAPRVTVGGKAVDEKNVVRRTHYGTVSAEVTFTVQAGGSVVVTILE